MYLIHYAFQHVMQLYRVEKHTNLQIFFFIIALLYALNESLTFSAYLHLLPPYFNLFLDSRSKLAPDQSWHLVKDVQLARWDTAYYIKNVSALRRLLYCQQSTWVTHQGWVHASWRPCIGSTIQSAERGPSATTGNHCEYVSAVAHTSVLACNRHLSVNAKSGEIEAYPIRSKGRLFFYIYRVTSRYQPFFISCLVKKWWLK